MNAVRSIMSYINDFDKDTVYKILKKYGYRCPYKSDIGNDNIAKLSNEQKAIATDKGWTLI